jgi:hypothetical protein
MKKRNTLFVYDEEGNKVGVMIPKSQFESLVDELEDYHDYLFIQKYKKKTYKTYTPEQVMAELLGKR